MKKLIFVFLLLFAVLACGEASRISHPDQEQDETADRDENKGETDSDTDTNQERPEGMTPEKEGLWEQYNCDDEVTGWESLEECIDWSDGNLEDQVGPPPPGTPVFD